jgi:hypothetical protein
VKICRKCNLEKEEIQYRLQDILRNRLYLAIRNEQKTGSAIKDLGCSINDLKIHLEKQFKDGMSWDNYGFRGWHFDHIKPLASFDLSKRDQLVETVNYKNLQPLWWKDNLSKGNKIV